MFMKLNKAFFVSTWDILKHTFTNFFEDRGMKLSASLAYYTIFSLAPMLIVIISLSGIFFGSDAIEGKIFSQINEFVGNQAALQIQEIIKNAQKSGDSQFAVLVGLITLGIGATGIFIEIQDSINFIWHVKAKPKRGWVKMLLNRFISFSLVVSLGFLLIVSLVINGLMIALSSQLNKYFPDITLLFVNIFNLVLTFSVISFLFAIIFKILPDVKIRWRDVSVGAMFTALLFMLGKYFIGLYLGQGDLGSAYGAAGSLIIILLWVYYSSVILYFGAEFTQVYAEKIGCRIEPSDYAVYVSTVIKEKVVDVLPKQN